MNKIQRGISWLRCVWYIVLSELTGALSYTVYDGHFDHKIFGIYGLIRSLKFKDGTWVLQRDVYRDIYPDYMRHVALFPRQRGRNRNPPFKILGLTRVTVLGEFNDDLFKHLEFSGGKDRGFERYYITCILLNDISPRKLFDHIPEEVRSKINLQLNFPKGPVLTQNWLNDIYACGFKSFHINSIESNGEAPNIVYGLYFGGNTGSMIGIAYGESGGGKRYSHDELINLNIMDIQEILIDLDITT